MPRRSATCQIVSPGVASTSAPSRKKRMGSVIANSFSDVLQPLHEGVDLGLCPSIAVMPEFQQRLLVDGYPVDHLRRHLANDPWREAVGDHSRSIGDRYRKDGLRSARLHKI